MRSSSKHIHSTFDEELRRLKGQVLAMGKESMNLLRRTVHLLLKPGHEEAADIVQGDVVIDEMEREIDLMATSMIALRQPMANDLRRIVAAIKIASDIERFADYACNIAIRTPKIIDTVPKQHIESLLDIARPVFAMQEDALKAYADNDMMLALAVHRRDEKVDKLYDRLFREMLTYMMEDARQIASGVQVMFIAKHLERMGDHVKNLAEELYYQETGKIFKEEYAFQGMDKNAERDVFDSKDDLD